MDAARKRIMLIEPPFYRLFKDSYSLDRYPLGLAYLAATIRRDSGWDVKVYNADFIPRGETQSYAYLAKDGYENYLRRLRDDSSPIWAEVKSKIMEYRPHVAGISAKSQNFASACVIAHIVKEINPSTLVIVGGPHPTMVGAKALDCADIDVCVKGEGEGTILELLNAERNGHNFANIAGIAYRSGPTTSETPARQYIEDLDSLPFPHEGTNAILEDYNRYPLTAFSYVFGTRGCPNNCFFCGSREIWGRKVRFRSVGNIVKEIAALQVRGLRSVHFADDTFGVNRKFIIQLCNEMMLHCPGLKWGCEIHVRLVDDEIIALMKKAGCFQIQVGIESGNNEMLRLIRKNITIEDAFAACRLIKKHGIELEAFFMLGFPQETEASLADTVRAIEDLRCDHVVYSVFTPYPGTEAFDFCNLHGLIPEPFDVSLYNHQSPANSFCLNIPHDRFVALARKAVDLTVRKNRALRIRKILSGNLLWKIRESGLRRSVRKVADLVRGS